MRSMYSSTRMKFIGGRGQDPFGYWRATKTRSSSTKEPANNIAETAINYFKDLFTSSNPTDFSGVLQVVDQVVTPDMNTTLLQRYNSEEVKQALFQMHPSKSPRPDGMPLFFFQKYWHIVGQDVTIAVLSVLNSSHMLHKMNFTHIVLIPKNNELKNMSDYRPISLGNAISRIVSKVVANRLKHVLPMVIFNAQSAFVPNKLITDNTIVAYELLHRMRNLRKGRMGQMAVKLDISKAYDRVEWGFLRQIMLKLGFDPKWVQLAMETITTASYLVLINGEPHGFIKPTRGLKQGDPLSLYLFLLCAEGLSAMLRKAEESHTLRGILSSQHEAYISHLLFADDSLLFCQATVEECQRVYKARYFPYCSFLMAELGSNPSVMWRSLLAARDVVREGSTWQIGDGSRIGVTTHKWLPNAPAFLHEPNVEMKVCELIDHSSWQWDRGKLVATFTPRTCKKILSLPLNHVDSQDTLVWTKNKAKTFSVKTAYRVALRLKSAALAEHLSVRAHGVTWGKIWKLNVPPKVRTFLWRACSNCLPTRDNLSRRKKCMGTGQRACAEMQQRRGGFFPAIQTHVGNVGATRTGQVGNHGVEYLECTKQLLLQACSVTATVDHGKCSRIVERVPNPRGSTANTMLELVFCVCLLLDRFCNSIHQGSD
ncbi:uncharacterized protein LOC142624833 [Castanea sativa]|uniref:uncharacterized protein LOC142624833 n=1 Tax=Castanea sativa TaxID=21020 RepID=UPI003F64975A